MAGKKFRESIGLNDEIVYHYCSVEAMYGIFSSKSFWLTFLESSNDTSELKLAAKSIKEAISELKNGYPNGEYDEIFNKIEIAPKDNSYNKYKPRYRYYGVSLVKEKDSLTHWERYANNAGGVCIGMNIAIIKELLDSYGIIEIFFNWLQSNPIKYSNKEQIEFAKSSIEADIKGLSEKLKGFRNVDHICSFIYYRTLSALKPLYKHQGFESEKEHRICLTEGEAEANSKRMKDLINKSSTSNKEPFKNMSKNIYDLAAELKVLKKNIKHQVFKDGIRSYYALNLENIWSDELIPEVVLGPKCYQNKKELQNFLKSCELIKTKISVSKIPLR